MNRLEMNINKIDCRTCKHGKAILFQSIGNQDYWHCTTCTSIFMDESCLPTREAEFETYRLHQNNPHDSAYRKFLSKLAGPLIKELQPAQEGLDYGCGPGPALAYMFREAGHRVRLYDPFFHNDRSMLNFTYDFIICSETVEHFHHPFHEFQRFNRLLKPGGWLAIMTSFLTPQVEFTNWHYRRDPTHVVFFREETFQFLAAQFDWKCKVPQTNVVLMQKQRRTPQELY